MVKKLVIQLVVIRVTKINNKMAIKLIQIITIMVSQRMNMIIEIIES